MMKKFGATLVAPSLTLLPKISSLSLQLAKKSIFKCVAKILSLLTESSLKLVIIKLVIIKLVIIKLAFIN